MKHGKFLLALLLAVSLSPCAKASVISLGTFNSTNFLLGFVGTGSFSDTYAFDLPAGFSNITDVFNPVLGVSDFGFDLKGVTSSTDFGSHGSYGSLPAGLYDFIFTGNVSTPIPFGIYFGDYNVASAGAVPELDICMMLLIGAGLLIYQLRRRQNALRHSELAGS